MSDQNRHIKDDQLQAFLDGTLEPPAVKLVQAHLDICPTCREGLANLEMVVSRLERLPEVGLEKDLSQLVVEKIKDQQTLSPAVTWTLVVEALAAGVMISLLIPAFQAAGWVPRLLNTRLTLQAEVNDFLSQLVNSWLVWWTGLKLDISQLITSLARLNTFSTGTISPWIMIGLAGALIVLLNAFLLGREPQSDQNHHQFKT